jgi:hypothetical protein
MSEEPLPVESFSRRWEPAVPRSVHFLLSGLMWAGVGIMLSILAIRWWAADEREPVWSLVLLGVLAALVIHRFGFSRLADRNVSRIAAKRDRFCIFAFQEWKSYLIIVVMMAMGMALRRSPISKFYLATVYLGIGGGLFLSSFAYLRRLK